MSPPEVLVYALLTVCGLICLIGFSRTSNPGFPLMGATVIAWSLLGPQLPRWLWPMLSAESEEDVHRWWYMSLGLTFAYYALVALSIVLLERLGLQRQRKS